MPITSLPTPPSRTDAANFNARADAFLGALPTFAAEANALATEVNGYVVSASSSAASITRTYTLCLPSAPPWCARHAYCPR